MQAFTDPNSQKVRHLDRMLREPKDRSKHKETDKLSRRLNGQSARPDRLFRYPENKAKTSRKTV